MRDSRDRKTRIVCTLGPACAAEETLLRMVLAGMDVARLNFSHGTHESHARMLAMLRKAAGRAGRRVGVLQDLCGPKIRVGEIPGGGVDLAPGQEVDFAHGEAAAGQTLPVEYDGLARDVRAGDRILFDDGAIEARVSAVEGRVVRVAVERGGRLRSRKGMNLPGVAVSAPSVTAKDLDDLEWGLSAGIDAVALSFVRRAADLDAVLDRVSRERDPPLVFAKIETPQALEALDAILRCVDGVMVARGDLGVEMAYERVPVAQKEIVRAANELDVPAITATQMLESMMASPRPTRAEASDVANAILDGSDAVMLSGETAAGAWPVESVAAMARIAIETESWQSSCPPVPRSVLRIAPYCDPVCIPPGCVAAPRNGVNVGQDYASAILGPPRLAERAHPRPRYGVCSQHDPSAAREAEPTCLHDALALGVERMARSMEIKAIVAATLGGDTARYLASSRPAVPVVVISPNERTLGRMMLYRGLTTVGCPSFDLPGDALTHAERALIETGIASAGDTFVLVVGRGPSCESAARIHVRKIG